MCVYTSKIECLRSELSPYYLRCLCAHICVYIYLGSELKCIVMGEKKALGRAKNSLEIFPPNHMTGLYGRMRHLGRLEIWRLLKRA